MDYHLYHHDDLDGVTSGAVLFDFFKKRGDEIVSFTPLEYSASFDDQSKAWEQFEFKKPSILVDFRYHPAADWWIDHHQSAFAKPAWQEEYKNDDQHMWDPKAPSACGLVVRFLQEVHRMEITDRIHELARVVDIDDSAGYATLEDALELDTPSRQIQLLLGDAELKKDRVQYVALRQFLIKNLITAGMDTIVNMEAYSGRIAELRTQRLAADEIVKAQATVRGNVIIIEKEAAAVQASRWAAYAAHPHIPYSIQIREKADDVKISIGSNKWCGTPSQINLGEIAKRYGGGGHFGVGAIFVKDKKEAQTIVYAILEELNKQ